MRKLRRSFYRKRLYKIMTSLVVPGLDTLRQWLDDLGMSFFECDNCQALHLPHMQNFDGVFDAKINLIDNTILFSAMAEVRPSAVLPLAAGLSAINASSLTVKAFLICRMIISPKLVVCQSLSVMQGVTYEQFAWFVRQSEEQISMVILEANAHQLLLPTDDEGKTTLPKTISSTITPFEHAGPGEWLRAKIICCF
ncbi:YbjN domain-containing protein [Escherichia coli]